MSGPGGICAGLVGVATPVSGLMSSSGTPRYVGHVESCFGPFGDSVILMQDRYTVCTEDTIGSEIILDAPNGTSR